MNLTLLGLVSAILGVAVYVVCHALVSRYLQPKKRWAAKRNLFFVFVVGLWFAGGSLFESAATKDYVLPWVDLSMIVLLILMIHVGYLTVYAFFDRSITLRTFVEIEKGGNLPVTYTEAERRYDPQAAYLRRLDILESSGYLLLDKDQKTYTLTQRAVRLATLIRGLKSLYRLGP